MSRWLKPEFAAAAMLLVGLVIAARTTPGFWDGRYLVDAFSLSAELALLALGMTLVIVGGQIDLSVAANLGLSACVFAKLASAGIPGPLAAIVTLCAALILGSVNGILVAQAKLPSFLVTLGTLALYRGAAQALMSSASLPIPDEWMGLDRVRLSGIPLPMIVVAIVALVLGWLLHRSVWGRWIYAIGTNEEAARFAGVPVAKVKVSLFALAGLLAGAGALMMDSRLAVARFDHARGLELDAITAAVLGGASIRGGSGTVVGTMLALLLVAVVRTALGLANVSAETQLTVIGALLVVAVGLSAFFRQVRGDEPAEA